MSDVKQRVLAVIALALTLGVIVWTASWGWAEVVAVAPFNAIKVWNKAGWVDENYDWQEIYDRLETAHRLNPLKTKYLAGLAKLHDWRAFQQQLWPKQARQHQTQAAAYYRRVIQSRPSWGLAWAHLARSKALSEQFDAEISTALEKAMVFGPWEPEVQREVIWVGFVAWEYLPEEVQRQVSRVVTRALERGSHDAYVIKTAVKLRREEVVRPLLTKPNNLKRLEGLLRQREK